MKRDSSAAMTTRLFEESRKAWGKEVYGAWPQIAARIEHALWRVWNEKYGPLNPEQLSYAEACIVSAIRHAAKAPTTSERYAWFNTQLTRALNFERVDEGFKSRREEEEGSLADVIDLDSIGVAA